MFRRCSLLQDKKGAAVIEAAMLFPLLITMLFGLWDLGNGILYSQHTVTASQVVGDLITREKEVTTPILDNYIEAGRLAYGNNDTSSYGIDILSVRFGENGAPAQLWRETRNMVADTGLLARTVGLGDEGEGVVVVTVVYDYEPLFVSFFTGNFLMREESFLRGRRSNKVTRI